MRENSKSILFAEKHSAEAEAAAAEMGIQFAHGAIDVLGGPVGTQEDSKSIVRASLEKIISGINNFAYLLRSGEGSAPCSSVSWLSTAGSWLASSALPEFGSSLPTPAGGLRLFLVKSPVG